jgi:hypothetical protein
MWDVAPVIGLRMSTADVVGLDCQFLDRPAVCLALVFDQGSAILGDRADKHGLASFRAPDQMIHDPMDSVFIALILDVDSMTTVNGNSHDRAVRSAAFLSSTATEMAWLPESENW